MIAFTFTSDNDVSGQTIDKSGGNMSGYCPFHVIGSSSGTPSTASSPNFGGGTLTLYVRPNSDFGWIAIQTFDANTSSDLLHGVLPYQGDVRLVLSGSTSPDVTFILIERGVYKNLS